MKNFSKITVLCALLLSLAACSSAKEQLGLTRKSPDEFSVVKRAPLEMPPDYTLRPPRPGTQRPQEANTAGEAQAVVFGGDKAGKSASSDSGESALLKDAGADKAQPGIRQTVDHETAVLEPKEKTVSEKLLGWAGAGSDQAPASVVDAKKEAERLKQNEEEGKAPTDGETPTVQQ